MIFDRLPRRHTALLLLVAVIALALVGRRLAAAGTATAPAAQAVSLSPGRGSEAAAPRLVVYVVGAVRRAGLVRVAEGARVADALERAGGPSRTADLTLVNLAAPVADGQQIVIPERAEGGAGGAAGAGAAVPAKVSLASATTLEELDGLPGIGPVTTELPLSLTAPEFDDALACLHCQRIDLAVVVGVVALVLLRPVAANMAPADGEAAIQV
jgi:competence protein ComEA